MKMKLKITLKSDLCVASGYSYKGIVDTDVCYDDLGLPYIPARRLKGCLRDTAENILFNIIEQEDVIDLFGVGALKGGQLRFSNAKIKNYDRICEEILKLREQTKFEGVFTQQRVLEQYTHIVAQTAISENNTAEDKSLRYTRVINHYVPVLSEDNKTGFNENVFEADIEYNGNINNIKEKLELIAGATKHIGLKRNRGMGNVQCEITSYEGSNGDKDNYTYDEYNEDKEYVITYTLKNDEPLMLSQLSDTHSEKYISGQAILGQLAGKYLNGNGTTSESNEFNDLFLNGVTKYTAAYPAEVLDGKVCIYYPAPLNINKLKKTHKYVDTFFQLQEEDDQPGNQPKKLKNKYLYLENIGDNKLSINEKEVDMKLYYHHRKDKLNDNGEVEEGGKLYPSEAIEPNQIFSGQIHTKGKYLSTIISLINNKDFYFGKSKGAQYGHCVCKVCGNLDEAESYIEKRADANRIVITFLTDAVFASEDNYTVESNEIINQLIKLIPGSSCLDDNENATMMETGLVSGYQTMWNLHKPLYPIVKAGSCFVLNIKDCDSIPCNIWVGIKNQEGFGYARVECFNEKSIVKKVSSQIDNNGEFQVKAFRLQCINILKDRLLESILDSSNTKNLSSAITKTQISRAILMLKQCKNFEDFRNRINSIKTDSVRSEFIEKLVEPLESDGWETGMIVSLSKLVDQNAEIYYETIKVLNQYNELDDIWKEYLLHYLTICKYEAKED